MGRWPQDDTRSFRQRLDEVLRTRDPASVRDFLVAEGQWDEDATGDTEFAMWMMIAGSPALAGLHAESEAWLRGHGHAAEADIIGGSRARSGQQSGGSHQHRGSQDSTPRGSQDASRASQRSSHRANRHPGQRPPRRSGPPRTRP